MAGTPWGKTEQSGQEVQSNHSRCAVNSIADRPPMTPLPPNIPTPIATVRDLFEIPDDITYLNCASMSPQLRSVTEAGLRAVRTKASPWNLSGSEWFAGSEELRALAARVMGA